MRLGRLLTVALAAVLVVACSKPGHARQAHRPGPQPTPVDAQFIVDNQPVRGQAQLTPRSHVRLNLTHPMRPDWLTVFEDGLPLPTAALTWADDRTSVEISLAGLTPGRITTLDVAAAAPFQDPGPLQARMLVTVPSNTSTGVGAGFKPKTPLEIVVENSGPARPQAGLQDADVVYEYLSEYSITRMTAIYFNRIPNTVGPVRSCRMINPYLGFAYAGVTMCSGVSNGTSPWMFGAYSDSRLVPNLMEPYDQGGHFFRSGSRAVPHNAYTSSDRAGRLRSEWPQQPGDYAVDPPHDDASAGQPADPPSVPLHGVSYSYDPASAQYFRSDHGQPFTDENTGRQLSVKTVALLHVPFHDAGWVEDDNGGAHSVWYDILGSGPAEVYSRGQVVHATWHLGSAGQAYYDNHSPVWFTDEAGKVMALNSGLTWIHVLGNGQERCPETPSAC